MSTRSRQTADAPLHLNIYRGLKAAVVNGDLAPGQVLNEAELARRWEVSRTPVREAIRQLEQEHLVRWSPRRGATVASITVAGVRDLYEVREALEGLTAQLAAQRVSAQDLGELERLASAIRKAHDGGDLLEAIRLDDQLHRCLVRSTGNRVLESHLGRILDRVLMGRMTVRKDPGRIDEIVSEHDRIISALRRKDAACAEGEAAGHIRRSRLRLLEMLHRSSVDEER
jgi:DNA-binding GntR family transcriptional regulator